MKNHIKKYLALIICSMLTISAYATNYYTSSNGVFETGSNWIGGTGPGTNYLDKTGGVSDTVFVRDAMTIATNFSVQGSEMVLIIETGGSITVSGTGYINGAQIIIQEGALLDFSGTYSTANNATDRTTINGTMHIGGDINNAAGTWLIGQNGKLTVNGNISNNDPDMNFINNGRVYVKNNVQFFTGAWTNGENSTFRTEGLDIFVGSATINNNGSMEFVNVENNTTWSGTWDCDGDLGTGSVDFGTNMDCAVICNGGGSSSCSSNVPLPVEWLNIAAVLTDTFVEVNWSTSSEKNNDFFVVEKSYDTNEWFAIGSIDGSGNSSQTQEYNFKDENKKRGIVYYRISQIDFDGHTDYSSLVFVKVNEEYTASEMDLYPNPNNGEFYVNLTEEQIKSVEIYNLQQVRIPCKMVYLEGKLQVKILGATYGYLTAVIITNAGVQQKNFLVR